MIGENIYNLFKQELDGEEFEDDDDALRMMNVAYRKILAERDWLFLRYNTTLTAGTLSLSAISTTLTKILDVWATKGIANDQVKLKKADYADRFDYEGETKDFYHDHLNGNIEYIYENTWDDYNLLVDYKYKPADLTMSTAPIFDETYQPRIAYEMILAYKRADETFDGYKEIERKNKELENLMVDEDLSKYEI